MPREIDEDLIEATIRKVAEARAARDGGDVPGAAGPALIEDATSPGRQPVDEDLIEATIRRVAEANASRETGGALSDVAQEPVEEATPSARQPVDEDLIEATIRRVAAQKAAKLAGDPDWEHVQAPPLEREADAQPESALVEAEDPPTEATAPSVRAFAGAEWEHHAITAHADAPSEYEGDPVEYEDEPPPTTGWPGASRDGWASSGAAHAGAWPTSSSPSETDDPIERIERTLAALIERVDAIVPIIERLAGSAESEWQDAPFPRIGPGGALRSVLRDPSPRAATAEHLEPEVIDTRPIPKPLPPLEPKRNIDLLPRTYRITVEDKRRGVDLVPLHRALLSIEGVRDMSLLSYNNGIAMVSLEATTDIEPETVRESVSRAMAREARIETNNEHTMVVKLAED